MSGADSLDFEYLLKGDGDELAKEIVNSWVLWKGGRSEWERRVQEVRKYLYATSTKETTNIQNAHDHTTHIPKIAQISDNLHANYMAALFPNDEWLAYIGEDEDSETFDKKEVVLNYIQNKHRLNKFTTVIETCIDDWIQTGNCFGGVTYRQELHSVPETGEVYQGYVGPFPYRIAPEDICFNPLATNFESSPKIIRSLKTMGELHRMAEEQPEGAWSQDLIDKIIKMRGQLKQYTDSTIDKHSQMVYDGFGSASLYYKSGYIEILEFYGDIYDTKDNKWMKNHVITVADRKWVIRSEPYESWTGRPSIFHCGWRLRSDNLWAMGPLDNLIGMQYLVNHLENARADAFDQMIDPDRVLVGDVDIQRRGGAVDYRVPEGGSVAYLAPDTTVLAADNQIAQKLEDMEMYAGAPREAMGVRSPGEKTAFEVDSLATAASRIFQAKTNYFQENFVEKLVNAEIESARRNMSSPELVRIVDNDLGVIDFMEITREDITSNGSLVPVGARHFARQATVTQNLQNFMIALQQDPLLAQHFPSEELAKAWEDLLGFKRLDLFRKFGRVEEETEMQRLQLASQEQLQLETQVPLDGQQPDSLLPTQQIVGAVSPNGQ
jgi:hypothetical protein